MPDIQRYNHHNRELQEHSANTSDHQPVDANRHPAFYAPVSNSSVVQKKAAEQAVLLQSNRLGAQKQQQSVIQQSLQPIQLRKNNTGMPDSLKSGIESLSGISMDDVRVFKNSPKPAQLQAHAYAQGTEIHLASGQEQHLPHEAWHVVQQKQGRVKPTVQLKERIPVNDDEGLEKEADLMGRKAAQLKVKNAALHQNNTRAYGSVAQLQPQWKQGNHPNNLLDAFVAALDNLVQSGAQVALLNPTALPGNDGYTELWKDTADILVGIRDNDPAIDPNDRSSQIAQRLQNARYGYAVEAYASGHIDQLTATLPNGYSYALQAGRGATRPDIVVKNAAGADVAWFDITSANSLGHIDQKTGAGWQTKPYVAEITYPAFDITGLSTGTGRTSIGQRVATKNAYLKRQSDWKAFINSKKKAFKSKYGRLFKARHEPYYSNATLKDNTKKALNELFGGNFTDLPAKSMLRAFGLNPGEYGLKGPGGSKADGEAFLSRLYQQREENM